MGWFRKRQKRKTITIKKTVSQTAYDRLLIAIEMEKHDIIKAFEEQGDDKTCTIKFIHYGFEDYYRIAFEIKEQSNGKSNNDL